VKLRLARGLAFRERLVDLAVEGVIRIQYEHEPESKPGPCRRLG
jgi:hypothetical protein